MKKEIILFFITGWGSVVISYLAKKFGGYLKAKSNQKNADAQKSEVETMLEREYLIKDQISTIVNTLKIDSSVPDNMKTKVWHIVMTLEVSKHYHKDHLEIFIDEAINDYVNQSKGE